MNDPYTVPSNRVQSLAPLVGGIRGHVDAWRRNAYPGSSATTRRLLEHWFLDEHQTPDGQPFRYFFAQREATETLIYLYEVAKQRTLAGMAAEFASRPVAAGRQQYPRYVVKAATGSGKTKVMSLLIAWSYFHRLREADSELTMNSLVVAPNLIVFERLRAVGRWDHRTTGLLRNASQPGGSTVRRGSGRLSAFAGDRRRHRQTSRHRGAHRSA